MSIFLESAKFARTFGDPPVTVYECVCKVDGGTTIADFIGSDRILQLINQELPEGAEIQPNKNPAYHPRLILPKEAGKQGGSWKGGGGGWKGKSVTEIVTTAKTMTLSYVKDLAIKHNTEATTWAQTLEMVETGYKRLIKLLDLDSIKEEPKTPPQEATGAKIETLKTLTQMLFELQATKTVPEAASWWNSNAGSIKALSQGDKQILFATKNEHVEVLTAGAAPNEDEIPF